MLVDLPYFIQSSDLDAANDYNRDETSDHDGRLKYICPHYGLQSTLMRDGENTTVWAGTSLVKRFANYDVHTTQHIISFFWGSSTVSKNYIKSRCMNHREVKG